jgi:hypothetical protein
MRCKKCGILIPHERLKIIPNAKECISCSSVEAVGCVDMVYHKTGNTIQVLPKEQADKINKLAKRTTFGAMASLKGGSGSSENKKLKGTTSVIRKSSKQDFELAGNSMMYWLDLGFPKKAKNVIEISFQSRLINQTQKRRLVEIFNYFLNNKNA